MSSLVRVPRSLTALVIAALAACDPAGSGSEAGPDRPAAGEPVDGGLKADGTASDGEPARCLVPPSALPLAGVAGVELTAGSFRIAVDTAGRVDIKHADAPERSVFVSPDQGGLVHIARANLHAEEHQGSFSLDEHVGERCTEPLLDELRHDGGDSVALAGGFGDETAACASVRWQLQLCETAPGHLAFRLVTDDPSFTAITLRARSDAGERIFGMGEQFRRDRLDLKGAVIPVLSQEGGVGRGHLPITPAVNAASPGSGGSEQSTYYAAPHYLTNRLRSLFLEDTAYAVFDFRAADVIDVRLFAPAMTGRILYGDSPLALIERFTDYAGRMPPLPNWANRGAIVALARDLDRSREIIDDLLAHGAEISAVWNQTWSGKVHTFIGEQVLWNWVPNPTFHPDWQGYVESLAGDGIRTLCYVNSMFVDPPEDAGPVVRNLFQEALAAGYFVRDESGDPYLLPVTAFDVGLLDLTNPAARAWMKHILQDELLENAGCSGWMADFGEALPFEARLASGVSAATYHNQYPVEWMRLNREAIEEAGRLGDVLIFNRSGAARSPAYSLLLWSGDQLTTWDKYDGLVSALHGLLNGGFSGVALNHSDTGGYTSLSLWGIAGYERESEQLKRWTEMNAFTAVLRTHEGNQPDVNAQVYSDDEAMAHFARFTKVYKALAFYRERLFEDAATRGWPVVRHLWMHYPDDERAQQVDNEFLLGREILVVPIVNKCWTWPWCPYDKQVYLPAGEWVHLWSGEVYGDPVRGVQIGVAAPIGEPAVFYRRGSAVGETFVDNLQAAGLDVASPPDAP